MKRIAVLTSSDSAERLAMLRVPLAVDEIEVTTATSPEELSCACRSQHDLAVVDVGPDRSSHDDLVKLARRRFASNTEERNRRRLLWMDFKPK